MKTVILGGDDAVVLNRRSPALPAPQSSTAPADAVSASPQPGPAPRPRAEPARRILWQRMPRPLATLCSRRRQQTDSPRRSSASPIGLKPAIASRKCAEAVPWIITVATTSPSATGAPPNDSRGAWWPGSALSLSARCMRQFRRSVLLDSGAEVAEVWLARARCHSASTFGPERTRPQGSRACGASFSGGRPVGLVLRREIVRDEENAHVSWTLLAVRRVIAGQPAPGRQAGTAPACRTGRGTGTRPESTGKPPGPRYRRRQPRPGQADSRSG